MFKLLPLIIFVSLLAHSSQAAESSLSFDLISTEQKGAVDAYRLNSRDKSSSIVGRTQLTLPTLKNFWTIGFSVDSAKKDYSSFLLRDEEGNETPLADTFDQIEFSGSASVSYQKGQNAYSLLIGKSLNESPFSFIGGSLSYNYISLNKKRILGVKVVGSVKKQPKSTYIDPNNFQTRSRPEQLTALRYETNWNEALSQKWRVNTILFFGTRKEDRPDHYGSEIRNGYGLSDELTFRVHTGFLRERKTELKDDRGHFTALWAEGGLYWELTYDLALEASYGLVIEREKFLDSRYTKIGTDSYGLKLKYEGKNWTLNSAYIFRETNTGYKSHTFQGGIQWII